MTVLFPLAVLTNEGFLFSILVNNIQLTSDFFYPRSSLLFCPKFFQKFARNRLDSDHVFNIKISILDPAATTHL